VAGFQLSRLSTNELYFGSYC